MSEVAYDTRSRASGWRARRSGLEGNFSSSIKIRLMREFLCAGLVPCVRHMMRQMAEGVRVDMDASVQADFAALEADYDKAEQHVAAHGEWSMVDRGHPLSLNFARMIYSHGGLPLF